MRALYASSVNIIGTCWSMGDARGVRVSVMVCREVRRLSEDMASVIPCGASSAQQHGDLADVQGKLAEAYA